MGNTGKKHGDGSALTVQTIYSDFFIIDELWPDYTDDQLLQALSWYQFQDITLGG
ncbi:MAG: hypothetical protein GX783_08550 [Clostridiales bacterium]|nr:hypothetical protein [Clostridiales bacterium]